MVTNTTSHGISTDSRENIIDVKNLSKHFEGLKAVDQVNFSIKSGNSLVALVLTALAKLLYST